MTTLSRESRQRVSKILANINAQVYEFAGPISPSAELEFLCTCGSIDCRERVRLTPEDYVLLIAGGGRVLASSHSSRRRARPTAGEAVIG